jgi:CNT family concentrative nucleoside transporter
MLSANKRESTETSSYWVGLANTVCSTGIESTCNSLCFFDWVSNKVVDFNVSEAGADFVFGNLIDVNSSLGYIFAFKVLPYYCVLLLLLLYYLGFFKIVCLGNE